MKYETRNKFFLSLLSHSKHPMVRSLLLFDVIFNHVGLRDIG